MKHTIHTVLPAQDAAAILARSIIESRHLEVKPNTPQTVELLATFAPDAQGRPVVTHFRIDITCEIEREAWRGEG